MTPSHKLLIITPPPQNLRGVGFRLRQISLLFRFFVSPCLLSILAVGLGLLCLNLFTN